MARDVSFANLQRFNRYVQNCIGVSRGKSASICRNAHANLHLYVRKVSGARALVFSISCVSEWRRRRRCRTDVAARSVHRRAATWRKWWYRLVNFAACLAKSRDLVAAADKRLSDNEWETWLWQSARGNRATLNEKHTNTYHFATKLNISHFTLSFISSVLVTFYRLSFPSPTTRMVTMTTISSS